MPRPIRALLAVDLALAAFYVGNFLVGHPSSTITNLMDLNAESNVPTWFASIQLFLAAILLTIVADRTIRRDRRRTWAIALVPIVFAAMSLDEVAMIHEQLGRLMDVLLPGHTRTGTALSTTGLWIVLIGIPAIVVIAGILRAVIPLIPAPRAWARIGLGLVLLLGGAIGVEVLSNLTQEGTFAQILQVTIEELFEFVGATIIVWGAWDLAQVVGFRLRDPQAGD